MTVNELIEIISLKDNFKDNILDYKLYLAGHPGELFNCTIDPKSIVVDHIKKTINIWLS